MKMNPTLKLGYKAFISGWAVTTGCQVLQKDLLGLDGYLQRRVIPDGYRRY